MIRNGIGYDVHRLEYDESLIIAGVKIPFEKGSVGHSDGDALTHAIIDALLGAAAIGDLGDYFSSDEEKWRDINSLKLLEITINKIQSLEYVINNIDSVVVLQQPKLKPFIPAIRKNLSDVIGINVERISVKATTVDNLGYIGVNDGWAAQAIVSISK